MALLARLFDFAPGTLIQSAQVDSEFQQLVDILSGVSTTKDALIKFSDATNPVLRVDQLGAGQIQRWLQNGTEKAGIQNNGALRINSSQTIDAAGIGINNDANNLAGTGNMVVLQTTGTGQKGLRIALEGATSGGIGGIEITKFNGATVDAFWKANLNGETLVSAGHPSTTSAIPTKTITLGGQYAHNVSTVGNVGLGIDDLHSYSIAANVLANDGDSLDFIGGGTMFALDVATKQIFFSIGGTLVFGSGAIDPAADTDWTMRITVVRVGSGSIIASCMYNDNTFPAAAARAEGNSTQLNGLTFTGAITMKWQGEESAVGTNNAVTQNFSVVRKFGRNTS